MNLKHIFKVAFLSVGLLLTACKEEKKETQEVLRPIKYETVGTASAQNVRTFSGTAAAGDEIDLSFRSSGIVTVLNIAVGNSVKKGQLLARLDNVQANLAYEQSVSALSTARSSMNTAKSSLDRIKSLYEKGSSSLSDYEKARNSYQSAKDQYDSAKKSRDIQKSKVDYGYIYAPKTGVIAKKNIGKNENVSAGQVIATLNAGTDLNVKVGLPESIINKTKLGMVAELKFSAIEDKTFEGSVIEISPVVDGNTSLYPVELDIKNPGNVIKPGMAVSITFNFNDDSITDNTLIIPVKAVGEDANGNFVFIVSSEDGKTGTVKKKTIEIGTLTSIGFEVKSGLDAGDKIATAGLQTLLDGQKVKLND